MNAREACELLRMQHKGWNIDGPKGVLRHLNAAQDMLIACPANPHVVTETDEAELPSLTTTTGKKGPYACASTFRTIEKVLVKAGSTSALANIRSDYGNVLNQKLTLGTMVWFGVTYVMFPYAKTTARTNSAVPQVAFSVDPGTTTKTYFLFGYRRAMPLTSTAIPLTIMPPWDEEFLLPAASALIEGVNHGNYIDARKNVIELRRLYQKAASQNTGFSGAYVEPVDRGY